MRDRFVRGIAEQINALEFMVKELSSHWHIYDLGRVVVFY